MIRSDSPTAAHLCMQLCDTKSFQNSSRYCGTDRTLLSKKSVASFLRSVDLAKQQRPDMSFHVHFIADSLSVDLQHYCDAVTHHYSKSGIEMSWQELSAPGGIAASIRECYVWMQSLGSDIVAQFQDDYIFMPACIDDCIDIFYQSRRDYDSDALVSPYNHLDFLRTTYHGRSIPRLLMLGRHGYWMQMYDISCSFLTSHSQFSQHWDIYTDFFWLTDNLDKTGNKDTWLENRSLNLMMTQRAVLGLQPFNNLCLHMQHDSQIDPYVDWQSLWNGIEIHE